MFKIIYLIYGNNEEIIQETSNPHISAQEFLKILSQKHDILFHHLYLNEKEIDTADNLINLLKQGYNTFTVSEKPISFNSTNQNMESSESFIFSQNILTIQMIQKIRTIQKIQI